MKHYFDYERSGTMEFRKWRDDEKKRARKAANDLGAPFGWEHRVDGGPWRVGRGEHRPPLYRRSEIEKRLSINPREIVFWVEGEGKADRLFSEGLAATCPLDGANSTLKDEDTAFLSEAVVVVLPDLDGPGLRHARGVVEHLSRKAGQVVQLDLPGLKRIGEDIVQWLDDYGNSRKQLLELALAALRDALESVSPTVLTLEDFLRERADPAPSLLGDGVLAKESLNVLAGDPGTGKTLLAINLAISLAAGTPFLGLSVPQSCGVLFLEAEGNRDMFRERVGTACRNFETQGLRLPLYFPQRGTPFEIGDGLLAMIQERKPGLDVLDTIRLFQQGEENSATDWKKYVVKPLREIVGVTGAAFLLLHHFGKPAEGRTGGHRVRGTSAIKGDVDSLLLLEPAKSGESLRVLTFDKIKNGPPLDSIVVRFDGDRALFERTSDDAVTALKPRLAEIQRIVLERGEATTAEIKTAIMEELELGRTQAEGLIESARAAGLIERKKRGLYGIPGSLLRQQSAEEVDEKVPF